MKWITALDLDRWGNTIHARDMMPALVGDLIRASSPEIRSFRFPSGDKGQVRGFDGWLEATGVPPYVPDGLSLWEFGVAGQRPAKALDDFNKRTKQVDAEKRASSTFVFVTTATWDNPQEKIQDWVQALRDQKLWKDVQYLDGSQLEDWLALRPAVSAMYASQMSLRPLHGARGADDFWDEYAHRFKSKLTEEVVLASREKQAEQFLQSALSASGAIELAADAPDEVIAFAIAAVRKSDPQTRMFLEDRIIILDTEEAARHFSRSDNLIFFPRSQANPLSGLLSTKGPTLVAKGRDQQANRSDVLARPSTSEFSAALQTMGLEADVAYKLARHAGRSITVLARQFAAGHVQKPEWHNQGASILPAVLAGGWDAGSKSDQEAVTSLAASTSAYHELEVSLRSAAKLQDPPIDLEGTIWKIRAPVDTFIHLGHLLGKADLDRLASVATKVFSFVDTKPTANDAFVPPSDRPSTHSSWLREGLATTLLQIAVLHDQADMNVAGVSPQDWVNNLIGSLPGLSDNHRLLASLRDELWLLVEAAPVPLLEALEQLLEGNAADAKMLFSQDDGMFAPTSPHNYVLWALEALSWDPAYIDRATMLIAKLASISIDIKATNRPVDSLRSIYLSWSPNTNANVSHRISALGSIIEKVPSIAWELCLSLLPRSHDNNSVTQKPRFREAGASQREVLTYGVVWEMQHFVIEAVLRLASASAERLVEVIDRLYNWTPEQQSKAFSQIEAWLAAKHADRQIVWLALNELMNKHQAFADTDWALPADTLQVVASLVQRYRPADALSRTAWLFDNWSPQMGGKFEDNERLAAEARNRAIVEITADAGISGVLAMVDRSAEPGTVAVAVAANVASADAVAAYIDSALQAISPKRSLFIRVLSLQALGQFGDQWISLVASAAATSRWHSDAMLELVIAWPDSSSNWKVIEQLSGLSSDDYWMQKRPFHLDGSPEEVNYAVGKYLEVGRASAAMVASHRRLGDLKTETIIAILDRYIGELNGNSSVYDQMSSYYVEHLFTHLDHRAEVNKKDVARLEYAYMPIIERSGRKFAINQLMADDPSFYMSLITAVFRTDSARDQDDDTEQTPASDQVRAKWRLDYQLLSQFHTLPGLAAGLDFDTLSNWVTAVRELAAETDRTKITDVYIGHLLAHSPEDIDGAWPHLSVRKLLQQLSSDDVDRGVYTERLNMRGVYTKAIYEGGAQERELAQRNKEWASKTSQFPRVVQLLNHIAERYEGDARREDERAALDKMRD